MSSDSDEQSSDSEERPVRGQELVRKVNSWFFRNDCFHGKLEEFARTYRGYFQDGMEEHSHQAFEVHGYFKQQFEGLFEVFLNEHGATMSDLDAALSDTIYIDRGP